MSVCLLIIRPQPGAGETASRAREMGLDCLLYPLFNAETLSWSAPPADAFDALMLTSANTLLHGGPSLDAYRTLPAYAVGQATTEAARQFGFENVITAGPDAQATAQMIANAGHRHIFHPGGRTVRDFDVTELSVTHVPVYHMAPSGDKDGVNHALAQAEVALVHSPRAGERLAELARAEQKAKTAIIAISSAAAAACGAGWRSVYAANAPSDSAMLAMARQICNNPDDGVFTAAPGPT